MTNDLAITLTSETMAEEDLSKKGLVPVDFRAVWCGSCRMMAPIIDELAEKCSGRITVGKMNVDDNPEIAAKYRIVSIPTLMLFKNGLPEERLVGFTSAEDLTELIDSLL